MKLNLALFATILAASVGIISSGGVPSQFRDESILADIRKFEGLFPRVGGNPQTIKLQFDIKAKIAITRGLIPSVDANGLYAIPPRSRCLTYDGYSLFLTPDNYVIATSSSVSGRYRCPGPDDDVQLYRAINIALTDVYYQEILQRIPNVLTSYTDRLGGRRVL